MKIASWYAALPCTRASERPVVLQPRVCSWSRACSQQKVLHHRSIVSTASRKVTASSVGTDTQLDSVLQNQASLYPQDKAPPPSLLADGNLHVQGSVSLKSPTSSSDGHVKMQVARVVKPGEQAPLLHRMVPPPRQGKAITAHQPPQQQVVLQDEQTAARRQPAAVVEQRTSAHNRAVRAEMASMASELQTKKAQLGKVGAALRQVNLDFSVNQLFCHKSVQGSQSDIKFCCYTPDLTSKQFSRCSVQQSACSMANVHLHTDWVFPALYGV